MTGTGAPGQGPVLLDVQGAQNHGYRDRGIARYVTEMAAAVAAGAPGLLGALLVNPHLAWPAAVPGLAAAARVLPADQVTFAPGQILHVASPYELGLPLEQLMPAAAARAGARLVVTVYDLIPEVFADVYLEDPGLAVRYRARHQLIRQADAVLAISEATKADTVRLLGIDPARVHVVGGGVSERFTPPTSRAAALDEAQRRVAGLRGPFVLYTGGTDARKNLEGLLAAWAALPAKVRGSHQLVVACAMGALARNHLEIVSGELGIDGEVILTGYVPDETLLTLYQATDLFAYPSRYEGYGLPVAEALACGAPVVAADTSCLPELIGPPGLFDPENRDGMAATITRALTDRATRRALLARSEQRPTTWAEVAERTIAVYQEILDRPPSRPAGLPAPAHHEPSRVGAGRVAVVTPLPPQPTPAARTGYALAEALAADHEVHVYVDGPRQGEAEAPPGVVARSAHSFTHAEAAEGPYDAVVYCLADGEHHTRALDLLRRRPGLVVALDPSFLHLYRAADRLGRMLPENAFDLRATLYASYPGQLPDGLAAGGDSLTDDTAAYWGILLSRPITTMADLHLTTSDTATELARLDAADGHRHKVRRLAGDDATAWAADLAALIKAGR